MLQQRYYSGAYKKPKLSLEIYIITDIHLRDGVDGDPGAANAGTAAGRSYYAANSKVRNFVDLVQTYQPDYAMCLGDMCDNPSAYPFWVEQWDKITVPKCLTIGNHDFDDHTYSQLITDLGYSGQPVLGGSVFNKSTVVSSNGIEVRVIILDTNFNTSDVHVGTETGRLNADGLAWFEAELLASTERVIIVASHMLPHYKTYFSYFNTASADAIQAVVDSAKITNPDLGAIHWFGGHAHTTTIVQYSNMGANIPGYRLPDSIEGRGNPATSNGCTIIRVDEDYDLSLRNKTLRYPYP